jgi:HEAT repeat protein
MPLAAAVAALPDRGRDVPSRASALRSIGMGIVEDPGLIDAVLGVLRDDTEPAELRKTALSVLQQSSFSAVVFAPKRPEYLAALRSIVDDRDAELRRRAIGILAREKDEYVQRRLLEGLERPSKALVAPAKAIQFLGYDIHAEYFPLLREIVRHPPSRAAKREAVRILGADTSSRDLLADLLNDKRESREVRNISAIALQTLAPDQFEAQARRIVLDDDEDDQLRSTCLTAMAHFGNPAALSRDEELTRHVEQLWRRSASPQLKQATRGYMSKYGS